MGLRDTVGADANVSIPRSNRHGNVVEFIRGNLVDHVKAYVNVGGMVNSKSVVDNTPLHVACLLNRPKIAAVLLADGDAACNLPNKNGSLPLHRAAFGGHAACIEVLLKYGADVDAANSTTGDTALHKAVRNGHVDAVTALVTGGADVTMANVEGKTAFEVLVASHAPDKQLRVLDMVPPGAEGAFSDVDSYDEQYEEGDSDLKRQSWEERKKAILMVLWNALLAKKTTS